MDINYSWAVIKRKQWPALHILLNVHLEKWKSSYWLVLLIERARWEWMACGGYYRAFVGRWLSRSTSGLLGLSLFELLHWRTERSTSWTKQLLNNGQRHEGGRWNPAPRGHKASCGGSRCARWPDSHNHTIPFCQTGLVLFWKCDTHTCHWNSDSPEEPQALQC